MSERRHGIFRVEIVADGTGGLPLGAMPSTIFGEDGTDPFPEVARILRTLADTLDHPADALLGFAPPDPGTDGKLTDGDGRLVGTWELT